MDLVNSDFGTIKKIFAVFGELEKILEDNSSHKNYSVYDHTRRVYKNALFFINFISSTLKKELTFTDRTKNIFLLKCLLHDIGKVDTGIYRKHEKIFPNHESRGAELSKEMLRQFDLTNSEKKEIIKFIRDHTKIHICLDGEIDKFHIKMYKFMEGRNNIRDFIVFCLSDIYGSYLEKSDEQEYLYRMYALLSVI
jgi:putative nucleotidyltransferase with HDIG domain